jgi:hypothetical protein
MLGYITDPSVDGGLVRRDLPEPRPGEHDARQAAGKVVLTR